MKKYMRKYLDLTGQKFFRLTSIRVDHVDEDAGDYYWYCQCECGGSNIVSSHNLRGGNVLSCGCLSRERIIQSADKKRENLIGRKFHFLTVVYHIEKCKWGCKCDCGNTETIMASTHELLNGKTKSCGCYRRKRLEYGENAFNRIFDTYRRRAKNRNLEFDLSKEYFKVITQQNCFYCGCEPAQVAKGTTERCYGEYIYNGLDRVDNTRGYTKDNVLPCCGQCNVAKNNYSQKDFINWIIRTYKNIMENTEIF